MSDNKKGYWEVGFSYYPHEELATEKYICYGTEEGAKNFCINTLKKHPLEFVRDNVSKDFNSNSREKVFIRSIKVTIL